MLSKFSEGTILGVTIKDVAKKAGVSIATVSMVVNNKAEHITMKTKRKVLLAIEELGYRPNFTARSLVSKASNTIGLLVPDITNPYFAELAKSLESSLNKAGYITFLCNSFEEPHRETRYVEELISRAVDGIIICGLTSLETTIFTSLKERQIPYLVLDNRFPAGSFSIHADDFVGGELAATHFIKNGHTKTLFIGSQNDYVNIGQRYQGYKETMEKYGFEANYLHTDLTRTGGQNIAETVFKQDITAVFCSNDLIAVGLYDAALKHNISIPNDLSIIGYDDISFASIVRPHLTTIHQPTDMLAEKAVYHLLQMINIPEYFFYKEIIPVKLVARDSVYTIKHP